MERPRYLTPQEMRSLLREAFARDPENSPLEGLLRGVSEPAAPSPDALTGRSGSRRLHPLFLICVLLALAVAAIFLVFTFARL